MKRLSLMPVSIVLLLLTVLLSSCAAIEGIFKAGMWTGILFVAGIIALVIFIVMKLGGKKGSS
jgi:hypothetical protein